ncbi:superoxide dismutase [Streptomyces albofaciens JCM 4342]|uniref:SMP-30/gluconolactonase/LRE family protein n=1 Tax=Streptomyces albofaciens TaxID=66866 RepID=UPI00123BCAF0|nr:superoxide dismutase [Streptomyces albofaciens]KAA6222840.1 superoxide dismutase [Streptomyces albofaciens JCM 4342]
MHRPLSRRRLLATGTALGAGAALAPLGPLAPPAHAAGDWPTTLSLPDGFRPEGIAIGRGPYAYFGSIGDGSVYRADLATGRGRLITGSLGDRQSVGLKLDARGRLFIAGGLGVLRVVDARGGAVLATYEVGGGLPTLVNDVVLTPDAAYFTDSYRPRLFVLPFGRHGELPGPDGIRTLPLTGEWVQGSFAANGIERTPDGTALLVVNVVAGALFRVDPRTGDARKVPHTGPPLVNGDGLLLVGRHLYVVQQYQNAVDVLRLNGSGTRGRAVARITDPRFDVPTTAAVHGDRVYLPNARLNVDPPLPTTTYTAVAVERV